MSAFLHPQSDPPGPLTTPIAAFRKRMVSCHRGAIAPVFLSALLFLTTTPVNANSPEGSPPASDRLVLSSGSTEPEPRLQLAGDLASWRDEVGNERLRILLRNEYRLLQSLYEQTRVQLENTESVRRMESSISELEHLQRQLLTTTPESSSASASPSAPPSSIAVTGETVSSTKTTAATSTSTTLQAGTEPERPTESSKPPVKDKPRYSFEKTLFFLLFAGLVVGCWLYLKHRRRKLEYSRRFSHVPPEPIIDPRRDDEFDDQEEEPRRNSCFSVAGTNQSPAPRQSGSPPPETTTAGDSLFSHLSENNSSIEEHFEANPVMELAEIMLSFGRVKGAAQALQDFIDSNPEESLKPWIRLMDVYRMAGMRSEFERVAAELNQHFNVEIQLWDEIPPATKTQAAVNGEVAAVEPTEPLPIEWPKGGRNKASSLEEAEHIADQIAALWPKKECADLLDQLLRSNRGGLRTGFTLPVVEEILFLIELQSEIEKMEAEKN